MSRLLALWPSQFRCESIIMSTLSLCSISYQVICMPDPSRAANKHGTDYAAHLVVVHTNHTIFTLPLNELNILSSMEYEKVHKIAAIEDWSCIKGPRKELFCAHQHWLMIISLFMTVRQIPCSSLGTFWVSSAHSELGPQPSGFPPSCGSLWRNQSGPRCVTVALFPLCPDFWWLSDAQYTWVGDILTHSYSSNILYLTLYSFTRNEMWIRAHDTITFRLGSGRLWDWKLGCDLWPIVVTHINTIKFNDMSYSRFVFCAAD